MEQNTDAFKPYMHFTGKPDTVDSYESSFGSFQRGSSKDALATVLNDDFRVRSPFSRSDYDAFRPNERVPNKFKDVILACRGIYLRTGIVRNVIDLLTDFATDGIRIVHPDKKTEAFCRIWAKKVALLDVADEFSRHFLLDGNVVVKRYTAKLTKPVKNEWEAFSADQKIYTSDRTPKNDIPIRYNFLNIAALYWLGGNEAKAKGERKLAFKPHSSIDKKVSSPSDSIVNKNSNLSSVTGLSSGDLVPIDMSTVYVAHNKKDSWEDWAPPFLYSVISDVNFRDKLKQAELSALDGFINVIRLWKLGDHKEGFLPNQAAVNKLLELLEYNTAGGAIDIVWDSLIDMKEFYPPVDKILGSEKYTQVNRDILIGLGIPEVLLGGEGANFSNSFIQLKTVVERINNVRAKLADFIDAELRMLANAVGFEIAPKVKIPKFTGEDENVSRKLIIGLLDRGIISVEAVHDTYGEDFLLEMDRIKNEKKIFKESGVEVINPLNRQTTGEGAGRPMLSKDSGTRDTRTAKPKRSAASKSELVVKGLDIINIIDETIVPIYLDGIEVTSARKLTNEQKNEMNQLRVGLLASVKPDFTVSEDAILDISSCMQNHINNDVVVYINNAVSNYTKETGKSSSLRQRKHIEAAAWAEYHSSNNQ